MMTTTTTERPWYCDVFERQRIALGYGADEVPIEANGSLDDHRCIDGDDYVEIERGRVTPAMDAFGAIAGTLRLIPTFDLYFDAQDPLPGQVALAETLGGESPARQPRSGRRAARCTDTAPSSNPSFRYVCRLVSRAVLGPGVC